MDYNKAADQFSLLLGLDIPPIALAFVDSMPSGISAFDQQVPSACALWRKAESQVFYASAEQHFHCPIGVMTMGFPMPPAVQQDLMGSVEKMIACGYLSPDELEKIPTIKKNKAGIVYGPLKEISIEPDLILLWLTPAQAMIFSEAANTCRWTEPAWTTVLGRPACAALPVAFENSRAALSLGCTGMRTFTNIREDRLLAVIPGNKVQEFLGSLGPTIEANRTMRGIYDERKAKFAG